MKGKMQYYEAEKERHRQAIVEINEAITSCRSECPHEEAEESTFVMQEIEPIERCSICGKLRWRR